jgi:phosphoribosylformylglycinamidine synthase
VVGLLGKAEPIPARPPRLGAATEGMELWLLGPDAVDLAGSSFEWVIHGHLGGRPLAADPVMGAAVIGLTARLASEGLTAVLHDVSDGGAAVAVAEICIRSGVGATIAVDDWRLLFSEAPHRIVAAIRPVDVEAMLAIAGSEGVPAVRLGGCGGETITMEATGGSGTVRLADAATAHVDAIPRRMG